MADRKRHCDSYRSKYLCTSQILTFADVSLLFFIIPQDFLTGKLAALGIDEDLELSGGEEECDDPNRTVTDRSSSTPASSSSNDNTNWRGLNGEHREPKGTPPNSMRTDENASTTAATAGDHGDDSGMSAAQRAPPPPPSSPSATKAQGEQEKDMEPGELETGELLQLLERPLQASRSNPPPPSQQQQQQQGASTKRASKRGHNRNRSSTSNNNGRAKGRNVTVKECAKWVCERLEEPKYYLMCQVVSEIGYNNSKRLLEEVRQTQVREEMGALRKCWRCVGKQEMIGTDIPRKFPRGFGRFFNDVWFHVRVLMCLFLFFLLMRAFARDYMALSSKSKLTIFENCFFFQSWEP